LNQRLGRHFLDLGMQRGDQLLLLLRLSRLWWRLRRSLCDHTLLLLLRDGLALLFLLLRFCLPLSLHQSSGLEANRETLLEQLGIRLSRDHHFGIDHPAMLQ